MGKKFFIPIGIGIVIIVLVLSLTLPNTNEEFLSDQSLELDFTYEDANSVIGEKIEKKKISISSPIILKEPSAIEKYCTFFEDESKQNLVEYCTSTELRDSEGNFLGNIHMVGSPKMPKLVLVLIQTDPFMSNLEEIKSVFQVVIESLVCECWEDVKPSNIETIEEWIERQKDFHSSAVRPHSKSNLGLEGKIVQIELTTNTEGYLWKLFVAK